MWEKKEKESILPDLPEDKSYPLKIDNEPEMEFNENEEIHGLPSFPDSALHKGFSQTAIKEAVMTDTLEEVPKSNIRLMEIEDWPQKEEHQRQITVKPMEQKPLFIRLDNFTEAFESFKRIQISIKEVEEMLIKIKEVKIKEETELTSWEKEIESVKARLSDLSRNLFDKVEN